MENGLNSLVLVVFSHQGRLATTLGSGVLGNVLRLLLVGGRGQAEAVICSVC